MRWPVIVCVLVTAVSTGCVTATPSETTMSTTVPATNPNPTADTTTTVTSPTTSTTSEPAGQNDGFEQARRTMVETQIEARGVSDPIVLEAMRTVPRHRFVPPRSQSLAYRDHPLPIGFGQTISQPYMVAWMTELLEVEPGDRVLEIGTGSGYQAAVLAEMAIEIYTVEIIPELAETAASRLEEMSYGAVQTLNADGYFGWIDHAPYDAIMVTAAPDHVPQPLLDQLKVGGHMVIPVGPVGSFQTLWRFTVDESGEPLAENLGTVSFVPLTRQQDDG